MLNCWHSRTICPFLLCFLMKIKFSVIKNKEFGIILERDVGLDRSFCTSFISNSSITCIKIKPVSYVTYYTKLKFRLQSVPSVTICKRREATATVIVKFCEGK